MKTILAGDIGGTKSLLGVFENGELRQHRRLINADFSDFSEVIAAFLSDVGMSGSHVDGGCLALAGPIGDDGTRAKLTNLPWTIDSSILATRFGLPVLHLANDFAAAALGAVTSRPTQLLTLQHGEPLVTAPHLVVGAGTGLGMALVLPEGNGWRIVPGEGGHAAFAPADAGQAALWKFLHEIHGRVSWERVVSGPGLAAIHAFVSQGAATSDPEAISTKALDDPSSTAGRALELFLAAYGSFAGDMALTSLPRGGVYLAGGIAAKVLSALQRGPFLPAFNAKAEHSALVAKIPVYVALDPELGLHGAARLALSTQ
jgi:glucokinase